MDVQNDKALDIALGNSRKTKTWKNKTVRWSELLDRLSAVTRTPETMAEYKAMTREQQSRIKDVGGFVGGYCNNGSRSDIRFRSVLCLDADFADGDLWSDWELLYGNAAPRTSTQRKSRGTVSWCRSRAAWTATSIRPSAGASPPRWASTSLTTRATSRSA